MIKLAQPHLTFLSERLYFSIPWAMRYQLIDHLRFGTKEALYNKSQPTTVLKYFRLPCTQSQPLVCTFTSFTRCNGRFPPGACFSYFAIVTLTGTSMISFWELELFLNFSYFEKHERQLFGC